MSRCQRRIVSGVTSSRQEPWTRFSAPTISVRSGGSYLLRP
jgi:hypothetical protein